MSSQTYRLEKRLAKVRAGGVSIVRIAGEPFEFRNVIFGGTSPSVCLRNQKTGEVTCVSAKTWTDLGAKF